ncbi:protein ABIL1-like isoform X2 [Salvia miltiorrhiza]|uniref:protein ABIL1-like isoform X2 n=1 Tax=Salvia miltiorrhiza TaxID=226208 RepID=UPI0025ABC9AA|nr:protein ABIL1-like isoform X2 [Salvia miltiorrhiza]
MEAGKDRPEKQTMAFDEMSVDKSISFVTALQELKNLRPQLYSAAEYCEKSYLNSEQKQMFLDNMKDYAVRALVNAVDHLGTVAYKLSDIVEQQTLEISSIDLKVACVNQKLLTCQTYTDNEGLRQQQLLAIIPKHHKHYMLPNSIKKVHFSPHVQTDPTQSILVKGRHYPSGASAARTLSWHLASATKSNMKGSSCDILSTDEAKVAGKSSPAFNSLDGQKSKRMRSAPATRAAMQTLGVTRRDYSEGPKPLTQHRSFDNPTDSQKEIVHPPVRSKSVLSAFFTKQKTPNPRMK